MRYLIIFETDVEPFFSEWYNFENDFNADLKMVVFDLIEMIYTKNGYTWYDIQINHL